MLQHQKQTIVNSQANSACPSFISELRNLLGEIVSEVVSEIVERRLESRSRGGGHVYCVGEVANLKLTRQNTRVR